MKKICNLFIVIILVIGMTGCETCGRFGLDRHSANTVYRYREGMEYPENMHLNRNSMFAQSGQFAHPHRIYALDSGYYYATGTAFANSMDNIIIMNFTFEEFEQGLVPEDWLSHWEDFVIVERPFSQCCEIRGMYCGDERPYDCPGCEETNYMDLDVLRTMIANGDIWNYLRCDNMDEEDPTRLQEDKK